MRRLRAALERGFAKLGTKALGECPVGHVEMRKHAPNGIDRPGPHGPNFRKQWSRSWAGNPDLRSLRDSFPAARAESG